LSLEFSLIFNNEQIDYLIIAEFFSLHRHVICLAYLLILECFLNLKLMSKPIICDDDVYRRNFTHFINIFYCSIFVKRIKFFAFHNVIALIEKKIALKKHFMSKFDTANDSNGKTNRKFNFNLSWIIETFVISSYIDIDSWQW
jgi:hypothetical protein